MSRALLVLSLVALLGAGCSRESEQRLPSIQIGERTLQLEIKRTPEEQAQGLSGRDALPEGQGMLFVFPSAGNYGFWMKDMRFAIDIVWLEGDTIVGIERGVPAPITRDEPPATVYPPKPVDRVLELTAGHADDFGLKEGMRLEGLP